MIDERQLITELELEIGETYNCDIGYGLKRAIEIVKHRPLVGEWIPCSGCSDCKHKECEHHGKI